MKNNLGNLVVLAILSVLFFATFSSAAPNGATSTASAPQTAPADTAESELAMAGNITGLVISGFATTQTWQGYFGNVTGVIQLADASEDVLYNWSLATPSGEVFSSTNQTVTWSNIQCFNFTANGTQGGTAGETAGGTSIGGLNLTQLETRFNITSNDADGVNETFAFSVAADTHDLFYTASRQFSAGECLHAKPYSSSGASTANQFEEVLLYEPATTSVIFASLLEEASVTGFDGGDHDFEMLVLEDGHGTDVSTTTYYFFVELE